MRGRTAKGGLICSCQGCLSFHRHSRWLYIQQQSSLSSSNRFIEHDVSTWKLGPSSGIRPSFLNRPIYTFMLLCLGVATHCPKLFGKNADLCLEISSCLCGFAVKLCWNRVSKPHRQLEISWNSSAFFQNNSGRCVATPGHSNIEVLMGLFKKQTWDNNRQDASLAHGHVSFIIRLLSSRSSLSVQSLSSISLLKI